MNINKLKGLMAENNCSRKDMAKLLGINEATLKNKILGKTDFKFCEVRKIAEHFNVDINIFLPVVSQNGQINEKTSQ